MRHFRW